MIIAIMVSLLWGNQKSLIKNTDSNVLFNTKPSFSRFMEKDTIKSCSFNLKKFIPKPKQKPHYKANYVVTAYSPDPRDNGGKSITYLGKIPRKGIIAVDPRYIPLHSKIFIEGYGFGEAGDIGGKIKGRHIDVCLNSRHAASRWGRKHINIIVYPNFSSEKLEKIENNGIIKL